MHLVASLGGHLELLRAVAPELADVRPTWVTSEGVAAQGLRDAGQRVLTLPRLDRGSAAPRSLLAGVVLALRERPRLVVTSGAGLAVPFCLVARALGSRLVHVETMARVSSGSTTGRVLSRVADAVLVQWDEMAEVLPGAEVCRPVLLEGALAGARPQRRVGQGTFVTVGSHDQPFPRLLHAVRAAVRDGVLPGPVVVQRGVAAEVDGLPSVDFLSRDEFEAAMARADVVVTHVGAGAVTSAVRAGLRPVVFARRQSLGEHVDDHQLQLAAKFDELGLAVLVDDRITEADVRASRQGPPDVVRTDRPRVADRLAELVDDLLARGRWFSRSGGRRAPARPSRP